MGSGYNGSIFWASSFQLDRTEENTMISIKNYYKYTWQWITAEKPACTMNIIHGNEAIQPFVVSIPGGRFWGAYGGAVITPNHKIIEDISIEPGLFEINFNFQSFKNKYPPIPRYYHENVALLQASYGFNYFHLMFDIAARLDLLRRSKIPIQRYVTNHLLPIQDELLSLLGIPKEQRIEVTPNLIIQAKELVAPSYTGSSLGIVPKWACHFLRNELLLNRKVEKLAGYERIYISRDLASHRKVINEKEVMDFLTSLGFKFILLEHEPIVRKIQIFHSANVVIAPHGAGLTNLLFCSPGTKVIELFSPNWMLSCFKMISQYLGLDYYELTGKGHRYPNRVDPRGYHENIEIDVPELFQLLGRLI